MKRCGDPLCNRVISASRPSLTVDGRTFCNEKCARSWDYANTALKNATDHFRNVPLSAYYAPTHEDCECASCAPKLPLPEPPS